jgi:serine/threonine-protein kinase
MDEGKLASLLAGKYELVRLLGRGGMGAVYEARNLGTKRRCAVKVMRAAELSGDAESLRRFFREARAAGLIECEHVVSALDSGTDERGQAYYVMEYLAGEDLSQALTRLTMLDERAAIKVAAQAARGLASAHALHIVHRDIKPANLFIAQVGHDAELKVKILDFGVAKVKMEIFEESAGTLTQGGSLVGTLQYMSPAQLRRASAIDATADIWSLGILLFECVTGHTPWRDTDGIGELVTSILTRAVPNVQTVAPWVSPGLAHVIRRATSRNAAEGYQSAHEMYADLSRLVQGNLTLRDSDLVAPSVEERAMRAERLADSEANDLEAINSHAPTAAPARRTEERRGMLPYLAVGAAIATVGTVWALLPSSPRDKNGSYAVAATLNQSQVRKIEAALTASIPVVATPVPGPPEVVPQPKGPVPAAPNPVRAKQVGASSAKPRAVSPKPTSSAGAAEVAASPAPAERSAIEKMGGTLQWPQSDIVGPP